MFKNYLEIFIKLKYYLRFNDCIKLYNLFVKSVTIYIKLGIFIISR